MRASLYNAIDEKAVDALIEHMESFEKALGRTRMDEKALQELRQQIDMSIASYSGCSTNVGFCTESCGY
ncbi:MAG: hypothetical protein CM1200mP9_00390 [Gammaproteobacteria bacterium]|nr:MAG: hypothetical protein CM1200mP9_00390 [Gammaproteobacteria bacterium]